jgi:hypothetical protein
MAVHMKDLLAKEAGVNDWLFAAMESTVMLTIEQFPDSVVPRFGSCVATKGANAVKYYKKHLTEFLDRAIPRAIDAPGRAADDGARLHVLHVANALACAGVTSANAYPSLRAEIARPLTAPFRPSDNYTLALAALATRHPDRAAMSPACRAPIPPAAAPRRTCPTSSSVSPRARRAPGSCARTRTR